MEPPEAAVHQITAFTHGPDTHQKLDAREGTPAAGAGRSRLQDAPARSLGPPQQPRQTELDSNS